MKRLIWLLATVCCLAFAQVQPVALPMPGVDGCDCCCSGLDCGCALPGCAVPAPVRVPVYAQIAIRPTQGQTVCRAAQPRPAPGFYRVFAPAAPRLAQAQNPALLSPPATAAVFLVHCSLLI
jgi:hypothetical protein